jgi:hypothetical protein
MNSQNQTDKATARPWQVLTANDYRSLAICGAGKAIDAPIIAVIELDDMAPDYSGGAKSAFNCDDNDEPKANAALIVRAVNEHAALVAVAEAAKKAQSQLSIAFNPSAYESNIVELCRTTSQRLSNELEALLANLAAVRGESEGGK